jgi:NADPH:quinone reductase-like Zn-dependent oxidoreductase
LAPEPTPYPLFAAIEKGLNIRGYTLFEINADPERQGRAKKFIIDKLAEGTFRPIIAKTFKLDQIVEAHRYMESNEQIGKIAVTVQKFPQCFLSTGVWFCLTRAVAMGTIRLRSQWWWQ